jgi:hypothetical protein
MNDAVVGLKRIPLHLLGFGIPFGILVLLGGWSGAAVLVSWRVYAENLDVRDGRDTLGKAALDILSQVIIPVVVAVWKWV